MVWGRLSKKLRAKLVRTRSRRRLVAIDKVKPNPNQPRTHFNETELRELSESIKAHGVLQPLLVRKQGDGFEIIAGERRYQAAKLAGLTEVPVTIKRRTIRPFWRWHLSRTCSVPT